MPKIRTVGVIFLFLLFLPASNSTGSLGTRSGRPLVYQPRFFPFDGGEKALYRGSWNGIPVATADVRTSPLWIDGKKYYQVQVQARTSKVLDWIWKMRDTVVAVFEAETLSPYRYSLQQRENRRRIDTRAFFDRESNKWTIHRKKRDKERNYEFVSEGTLDPVTAVYFARSLDFKVGDRLYFNVFGGKSRYSLTLDIVSRERIELGAGVFEAFKIIPRIKNVSDDEGHAEKLREATVWISADHKRIPLMIASKVVIGSVYLELIEGDYLKKLNPADLNSRRS